MNGRLRVVVADDHRVMLDILTRVLSREFEVVAAVVDGPSALTAAARLQPDLMVLDIAMPGLSGLAVAARLKAGGSPAKIVFVTCQVREYLQEALTLGDIGIVAKNHLVADLMPAVRSVLAGQSFVSPFVAP